MLRTIPMLRTTPLLRAGPGENCDLDAGTVRVGPPQAGFSVFLCRGKFAAGYCASRRPGGSREGSDVDRRETRMISVGSVPVGGGAPVSVQSMTNTNTADVEATLAQVRELEEAGCDIVRVAVPDAEAADALDRIIGGASIPVVADIHFDQALALRAIEQGVAGIRINPGTLAGGRKKLIPIARAAAERRIAVRVGVNAGSLERRLLGAGAHAEAEALAKSALEGAAALEDLGVRHIKISVKASDVRRTIDAYRVVADWTSWPLHVGVTEAGTLMSGTVKSAVGIGALLAEGIGDTIRVSLTAPPVEEVRVGRRILACLGLTPAPEVISCPTCARAEIDVMETAARVERVLEGCRVPIRVAVMGCAVNGPGEARDADVGLAGGREGALLFAGGRLLRRVGPGEMTEALLREVERIIEERGTGQGGA